MVGDWVRIIQNDNALINNNWALNTVGQIVEITQIINNELFFDSELRRNYKKDGEIFLVFVQEIYIQVFVYVFLIILALV